MKKEFKYILILLGSLLFFTLFFWKTYAGNQTIGYFLGNHLSSKTKNQITVNSLDLTDYPNVVVKLQVNNTAPVTLKGTYDSEVLNMDYHIEGDSFKFNDFNLESMVDVKGKLLGNIDDLNVTGMGKVFEGTVNYHFMDRPKTMKDLSINMRNINSEQVLTFLEQKPLLKGSANIDADFKLFSTYEKEGQANIQMTKVLIPKIVKKLPFILNAAIEFQNVKYKYEGNISSELGTVLVRNGHYNKSRDIFRGDYQIDLKDLSHFQQLVEHSHKHTGSLHTTGSILYNKYQDVLEVKGNTDKFGGNIAYSYNDENIDLELKKVSLTRLLKEFSYPILFTANVYGTLNYRIKEKIAIINTELKNTRFVRSKLTNIVHNQFKTNMLTKVYNKSSFSGGFKNSILNSTLKIDNGYDHIYLTSSVLNTLSEKVYSNFEIRMRGTTVHGAVYNTLSNPKLRVDTKFFTLPNKELDTWFKNEMLK